MEGLNRLVAESLARHGFDRPVDYRRLHWSRWFRCESPRSLLFVPSKPGVFALAEEIMEFGKGQVGTATPSGPAEQSSEGATAAGARRMLAVLQFGEDEDMAFVLDRMFFLQSPMRGRLASGRCFVRFVVIEDEAHRRSIAIALNQWLVNSSEKASEIGSHFASSLELTPAAAPDRVDATNRVDTGDSPAQAGTGLVGRTLPSALIRAGMSANANTPPPSSQADPPEPMSVSVHTSAQEPAPQLDSGAATNIHCPQALPSGF
jgi:hypothetical protein